ncbi:hypothetical protein EWM64_g3289 [Hericium alpestre]|uniref:Vacuolar protein sorting-associated protein n=1 Tax=Hericium alpestre TaxID=135208 RepID=A0A4Z0A333_9AGAM|nr:hypothetical protein EWM64_g3289 [Hericium alpestre]
MWWLDPGKEIFNRILAPYVENLDMDQVNYGIGQGQLVLKKLRLKRGALDKFRLPVDVIEGHLGTFTLSLHWRNLGNQPVEILIEDVYLLVVPAPEGDDDPEEEERRVQAAKQERLQNAELLHVQSEDVGEDGPQQQGLLESLIAKIVNNLQITIKNIHIRYEDKLSVPDHPFAAGITLAGFSAVSVDENWMPAFIESTAGSINKLSKLESLAVYFDTDAESIAGLPYKKSVEIFARMIAGLGQQDADDHQFMLKPVTGEGRVIMNQKLNKDTPRFDIQLLFDEIGVVLDDNQYRDIISLVDMFHFYTRQHQYRTFRPSEEELRENRPRALLRFAGSAILDGVHERNRKWTWAYFAERRDDRHRYVDLFKKKQLNSIAPEESEALEELEKKLSYEDIRFYRSIARSQLRKDSALRKKMEEEKKTQEAQTSSSWTGWLWGSSPTADSDQPDSAFHGPMTEEQRQELYDVLDFDEKRALAESFDVPRDALKMRVAANLEKGSLALKTDPHGKAVEVTSVVFHGFQATFLQRKDNFEVITDLRGLGVFDGTTSNTLYPQIVQVKHEAEAEGDLASLTSPESFFHVKFENNPLDERADTALSVRMRHMEIIYHRGYIEAIYRFFKPPASQLESVEALLNVASETLEGIRRDTRAGLEYALQTHKTIDLHLDMNAPIIIIPESITTAKCKHLVVDAGHISVESDLADKEALREIQLKRNQAYTDEDYSKLESLMYDKLFLKLEDAQFVLGDDLQSCRNALSVRANDSLHLIERITIDLQVQISMVPSAVTLSRFKVSGTLPRLQVNFSDTKYKSIMRLVDVTIPKFEDGPPEPKGQWPSGPGGYQLSTGLFNLASTEYTIDGNGEEAKSRAQSAEPEKGGIEERDLHQRIFELNFQVATLSASLSKTQDNVEKPLGVVSFDQFALSLTVAKYDLTVDIALGSLSMSLFEPDANPVEVLSSADRSHQSTNLLNVHYTRVQRESPEYQTVYEGFNQNVDIKISTVIFRAAPEPVITLYNFIMTTFVPEAKEALDEPVSTVAVNEQHPPDTTAEPPDKIRVLVKLASVEVLLVNAQIQLATLSLSTADASVLLHANTMRVHVRLGSLALSDDSQTPVATPDFQQIMSIEGENLAEFTYQTYDPNDKETYEGIKSSIHLSAASVKLHYLQQPLHDLYLFASKLAKLKGLYDAATQAAVQRASEIERMQFDISVKSPIVVIPSDPATSKNTLEMHLGEISASNSYEGDIAKAAATLRGIQLISTIYYNDAPSSIKLIDDIDITADAMHFGTIDRQATLEQPDTQVAVNISDIKLALTQVQYEMVIALSRSIPEVLAGAPEGTAQAIDSRQVDEKVGSNDESSVDLRPELEPSATIWSTLDVTVHVNTIRLQLYDSGAMSESTLKDHGIARFALNNSSVRLKQLSDGAMEAQVVLKSFTVSNTRPGNSKFREVIPAAHHDRNQFMILYTSSGGTSPTSFVILTIDSPHIIFAIDPVFALAEFFLSAFPPSDTSAETHMSTPSTRALAPEKEEVDDVPQASQFDFRVDVHDASVIILENDMDADSQAIKLSVAHVLVSQQGILALTVNNAGMSLTRMGKDAEAVRFLDDVDMTFALDSRAPSALHQVTNIEISSTPIVFRASYRDIRLILAIVNKATEAYGQCNYSPPEKQVQKPKRGVHSIPQKQSLQVQLAKKGRPPSRVMGSARVLTSREQLKATFEGFRLILIGDLHEQPMLHLKVKSYVVDLKDWSSQLQASTTLATSVSFWNLTNSHWEPLIDPWAFTASVSREKPSSTLITALTSRERLNLNISTVFVELAVSVFNTWSKEGDHVLQKARGSYAPYRIRNLTGTALYIWADTDGSTEKRQVSAQKLADGQTVDWRFDDWRTVREHASSTSQNSIAVQFLGQVWEQLRSIPVDREGEYTFALRPRIEKFYNRLLCEVKVEDTIKVVTLRSTYKVHNQTLYPLELTLIDESGNHTRSIQKIAPGRDYSLPIDLVGKSKIRIQPDQGFGYKWSPAMRWEDLIARQAFTLRCPHADETEAAFRFHAFVQTDAGSGPLRKYPKIDLRLRAPIELENLLPYNLQYRIYDKNADQNWRSYLRQGGVMPVHSVELGHLVLLNIEIQDTVFKPSDFAIINTDGNTDFDVENRLVLEDRHGRKLNLNLNYIRYPDAGGAFKVQIYSPYLLVNKTGLSFAVRSLSRSGAAHDAAGDTRKDALTTPSPFMLSRPNGTGNEFILQVDKSAWSKVINLEAPAADMELPIPSQAQKADEIHIGLSWTEGLGKYKLTKVITLSPRFLIKNNLGEAICFREHGVAPRGKFTLEPGERTAIYYMRSGYEKLLTVAFPGLDTAWSPPFSIEDIGSVHFRLKRRGDSDLSHLIRADVKMEAAVIFIFLQLADDEWPFVIENDSDYPVHYCQMDLIHNGEESAMASVPKYTLPPRSIARYAWDFPAVMEKKILLNINGARRLADIMEIGDLVPFRFPAKRGVGIVSMDVRASGRQQILRLTNYSMETSLYRPKPRHAESSLRVDTLSGSQEAFEAVTEEVPPTISFKLDFEGIGLSLINRRTIEVVYLSIDKQKFEYTSSPVAQSFNICCGSLQLDNQLHDAIFPVVLQPTPILKEARDVAALPTVQGSVIWLNDDEHGVLFIKYCSILLQALTIQADEDFLFSFYELSQIRGAFWEEGQEDVLIASLDEIPEPKDMRNGQDLYFEVLELQPIRLSLSFMRTEHVSGETKLSLRNPLAVVVNGLTMALGNVNDAALEMNALAIKDMRLTLPDLQTRITYHYGQEVLRQLYRILGSADFIGNPVGLFTNVSSGVADIFYEPFNGAVMSGNRELGAGIAKGAASFVKKTVFGVTDSLTKVTSSIGKGLSAVTLDSEFQKRRRLAQRRNKPRHAIYGVAAGAEAFATSLASGVEGIVMKPIEGAETGGAFGFFKGVGKGLVGVMTKPVVGALDLASSVTEGVRNTTTVFDIPARERVRLPRHVPPDNVVVAYSAREALGQYWMKDLDNGAYRNESYVAHLNLPGGDSVALLTMAHVIVFRTTNLPVEWVMPLTVIQGVTIEDNGIRFAHTTSKDQDRFIIVTDKSAQSWFFGQIALVVKAFNARRRMDS